MITVILTHVIAAIAGGIFGIFFYRNNLKKAGGIADALDVIYDEVKKED